VSAQRLLDVVVGGAILVVSLPVVACVAGAIAVRMGTPVLFRQERIGWRARPFTVLKFRTMRAAAADDVAADGERITALGRWLRAYSLDELPQLWNVLRGDMSLVGPRPLLPAYLARYSPEQARRHEVRPGITGLAQISGRNGLTWEEKFALDVWYVDHRSLALDLRILWRTLHTVLRRHGIAAAGHATMPEFGVEKR
jgi:lipopolysaccharide/colanic/teichoic acid biosynthesis glycosyltransferase